MRALKLTLTCSAALSIALPVRAERDDCYVALRTATAVWDGLAVQDGGGDACIFDVQACINEVQEECAAAPIARLTVRGGRGATIALPALGSAGACGASSAVRVEPGSRVRLRAKAVTSDGRVDRDRLTLECRISSMSPPPPASFDCAGRAAELSSSLGRLVDYPPSIPIDGCGEGASNHATPVVQLDPDAPEELHVVSVYQGELPPGVIEGPGQVLPGTVKVHVRRRAKPVALVLISVEPVHWDVHLGRDAAVRRIVVQGAREGTTVAAPQGVPVIYRSADETCGGAQGWEIENGGGAAFVLMMEDVRHYTGLRETSFQGCWVAGQVDVPYWRGDPPDPPRPQVNGDETVPREAVVLAGCEAVTAESAYCLTTNLWQPAVVGLDSGTVCPVASTSARLPGIFYPSLGWRGGILYTCSFGDVVRVSLRDGSWEATQVPCEAVTDDGSRLLVARDYQSPVYAYPSLAALEAGEPVASYSVDRPSSLITASPDRLLVLSDDSGDIVPVDLATGEIQTPITLGGGFDDSITGMAETGDGSLVVASRFSPSRLHVYDAASGVRLCDLHPTSPDPWGAEVETLACVSRRTSPVTCPLDPETTTTTTLVSSTTTTTIPAECTTRALSCCHGSEPDSPCWQTIRPSAVFPLPTDLFCESVTSSGDCPDNCAAPAACLLEWGCPMIEFLGDSSSSSIWASLCTAGFFNGCELREGACPADPDAPSAGTP